MIYFSATDIDESQANDNCGCEDRCENRVLNCDQIPFECFCDSEDNVLDTDGRACRGKVTF